MSFELRPAGSPTTGTGNSAPTQLLWMHSLRGLAIVLVVLFHADIHAYPGEMRAPLPVALFNVALEPLRMPLLVFLSGMLVPRSLGKGRRPYLAGKLRGVLYPYVVWTLLLVATTWVVQVATSSDVQWGLALNALANPLGHMWFLAYLMVFYVVALVTRWVPAGLVGIAALAAPLVPAVSEVGYRPFAMLGFFMLGVAAAGAWKGPLEAALDSRFLRLVGPVALLATVAISCWAWLAGAPLNPSDVRIAPLVLPTILWMMQIFRGIQTVGDSKILVGIGRQSIVYYVAHWPVMMLVGLALSWAPDVATFVGMIVAAFAVGLLLVQVRNRWHAFALLFAYPPRTREAPGS